MTTVRGTRRGRVGLAIAALLAAAAGCEGALPEAGISMGQEPSGLELVGDATVDGVVAPDVTGDATGADTVGPDAAADVDQPDLPRVGPDTTGTPDVPVEDATVAPDVPIEDATPEDVAPELPPDDDVPTTSEDVEDCQCQIYFQDFDGDGYGAGEPACLCEPIGAYNATQDGDCCDSDGSANPGLADNAWYTEPNACGDFDYDCDGDETPRWTGTGSCEGVAVVCEHTAGWSGSEAACGVEGKWVQGCNLGCNEVTQARTQGCH